MILLLWFYISGLVILIGAEMNAEIEHASPHGKDSAKRSPARSGRSARARMRAWLARRRRRTSRQTAQRGRGESRHSGQQPYAMTAVAPQLIEVVVHAAIQECSTV